MPTRPSDDAWRPRRRQSDQPGKSSPVMKILLVVFGSGAIVFLCCAGWFGYFVYQGFQEGMQKARQRMADEAGNPVPDNSGKKGFKAANSEIVTNTGGAAKGNSATAIKLAAEYSHQIRTLREAFFTKRNKKSLISLSDGEFLTYCRLDDEACVFLVHIPDLRKFTKEAKQELADLAWFTAQNVVRNNLETPPPKLAVGVRGALLYDTAMIGEVTTADDGSDGIETRETGSFPEKVLYVFFKSDVVSEGTDSDDPLATEVMPAEEMSKEVAPEKDTPVEKTETEPK